MGVWVCGEEYNVGLFFKKEVRVSLYPCSPVRAQGAVGSVGFTFCMWETSGHRILLEDHNDGDPL